MSRKRPQPLILTQPQEPTPLSLIEEAESMLLTAHERLSQAVKLIGVTRLPGRKTYAKNGSHRKRQHAPCSAYENGLS